MLVTEFTSINIEAVLFIEKYVPWVLQNNKRDECLELEKGDIFVVAYKVKFHALSRYATQLFTTKEETI